MALDASVKDQSHKTHRSPRSGPNAKRKVKHDKGKKEGEVSEHDRKQNPKVVKLSMLLLTSFLLMWMTKFENKWAFFFLGFCF